MVYRRCGINHNTFYYHFRDIYDLSEKWLEEKFRRAFSTDKAFKQKIRDLFHACLDMPEKIAVIENGEARMKRYLPVGITVDERICSGARYARFFKPMKRYLEHPELLETPPEDIRFDEGCEYHEPLVSVPVQTDVR